MSEHHRPKADILPLGRLMITRNALSMLTQEDVFAAIGRHMGGDWGDLDDEDKAANENALAEGGRLLSSYRSASAIRFWIITEGDRSATTVLLPEDY